MARHLLSLHNHGRGPPARLTLVRTPLSHALATYKSTVRHVPELIRLAGEINRLDQQSRRTKEHAQYTACCGYATGAVLQSIACLSSAELSKTRPGAWFHL